MIQKPTAPKQDANSETPKGADEEWQVQDDFLEEALEETFPGSDPISPGHVIHPKR